MLTAAHYSRVYVFAPVADESDAAQQNVAARLKEESTSRPTALRQASTIALAKPPTTRTQYMCLRIIDLFADNAVNHAAFDEAFARPPSPPTTVCWIRDGILVVAMDAEMRVYNQWALRTPTERDLTDATLEEGEEARHQHAKIAPTHHGKALTLSTTTLLQAPSPASATVSLHVSPSHSMLDSINKRVTAPTSAGALQRFCVHFACAKIALLY